MKAWQAALTCLGWLSVLALLLLNVHGLAPSTYIVVAIWAVGTVALLKTPPFPSRGIAFAVSWVGSLLVIVSEVYAYPNHRLEFLPSDAVIQVVLFAVIIGWFCTYGMLPIFVMVTLIRPKMRCRVFEGTEQVPWRYWWAVALFATTFKAATLWYVWSIISFAEKQ